MEDNLIKAIEQMKNGEEQGFNEVYSQTYNRVYFRARQIMKKEEDAQDLTQIVFVEAYKSIGSLQLSEAIYSWLDGITYRQGMKIFRKQKDVLLTEEAEGLFETLENNDIDTVPELTADQKATSDIVRGILEELPELQKTAVVMYYFDGMKVEQIAEVMECSANTIKSRLNYARKYLKDRVEEKEKKEGYRLHVFGFPVLWYAIKTLSDKTTLTTQAAQGVYDGACSSVGLQASIVAASETAGVIGAAEAAKAAGIGAKFAALSTGAKTLIIAGAVAILGTGVIATVYLANANESKDVFVIENPVQEAPLEDNLSEYLRVYADSDTSRFLKATKISDTEYCFYAEDLQEAFAQKETVRLATFLPDNLGIYEVEMTLDETFNNIPRIMNEYKDITFKIYTQHDIVVKLNYIDNIVFEEDVAETPLETVEETTEQTETVEVEKFELTEQAARQISSFVAAAYQCNYSTVNNEAGWNIFSMTPDDCLFFLKDYIGMVNAQGGIQTVTPNPTDLPFGWSSGGITEQEAADFFQYGLGIEIPADYSYSFSNDGGSLKLANGMLESTFDGRTLQVAGGSVNIESQDENSIVLSGTCAWYDPEETLYQFTVTGVPSGNPDVFGGITITNIEIGGVGGARGTTLGQIDLTGYTILRCDTSYEEMIESFLHSGEDLFIRETATGYEGYWTLNGQELYFTGKDASDAIVSDLDGNLLNIHMGLYTMGEITSSDPCIYIYTITTNFRDYPNYVYTKTPELIISEKSNLTSNANVQPHLTNAGTTWQLSDTVLMHFENGVFTVSGKGDMPIYKDEVAPWMIEVFRGDPTTVIVEEGITSISDRAFSGYLNITSVSLPSTLKSIGAYAFSSINKLQSIVIPDGVEKIGDKLFFNCYGLKEITIPSSVTEIGGGIVMSGNGDVVIYGDKGSTAESYAKKWEITFKER